MNEGITAAGNWIIDYAKTIDNYPAQDTLATILSVSTSTGGAAYNILIDLARMGAEFPLSGIGLIGRDATGNRIIDDLDKMKINRDLIQRVSEAGTSYTDVMIVKDTRRRTFFTYRGANAYLNIEHFDFTGINSRILHLGYPLLLDSLDEFYDRNRTRASIVLQQAREKGIITSLDLVSENSDRFKKIITPSLPHVDILFLNEFEASQLTDIDITDDQKNMSELEAVTSRLFEMGVKKNIFLHFPEGVFAAGQGKTYTYQGSVNLPTEKIKGTPGAGDALAAGILYGIHENWPLGRSLETGVCVAAASLTEKGCSEGVRPLSECLKFGSEYGYRKLG